MTRHADIPLVEAAAQQINIDQSAEQATDLPPLTAAERMARYRERRKGGMRCVMLEVRKSEIAGLVRAGLLDARETNDVGALKAALYRHLEETLDPLPSSRAGA